MSKSLLIILTVCGVWTLSTSAAWCDAPQKAPAYKALIVDGQNNHSWKETTPILKKHLEETGLFTVDVATSPAKGQDMSGFKPDFAAYNVVVSNYNGDAWPEERQKALVQFVRSGGGLVVVHAANNSFPEWKEYNEMIGLGGWGGRSEKSGPYVRYKENKVVLDSTPGRGGSHGKQHPFQVIVRDGEHPITAGLPKAWMHAQDELYDRLRGPATGLDVLATAYSAPEMGGSGEHEPMLMTITYGQGRVFHTTLGHSPQAMQCVGFIVTFDRGTEWAATGKVTRTEVPKDFPTADQVSARK
jgi:type 1 glutamine amidotransferase